MSLPISINFDELRFNLYEILGLTSDATEKQLKKNYRKFVILLHPDKNPESNEDLFNHLLLANQVFSNKQLRKDYDTFLNNLNNSNSFINLKQNFNDTASSIEACFPKKDDAVALFELENNKLNKKHGIKETMHDILNQYKSIKTSRDSQIVIPQENIINNNDFNKKFENKKETGKFNEQLIVLNQTNNNISAYQPTTSLISISDYSKLYSEDSVSTNNYTSLDMAFKIQHFNNDTTNKTIDEKMKDYKLQGSFFNSSKNDFSNKNFWEYS
jgi:curved DNA-binding protein CbpA